MTLFGTAVNPPPGSCVKNVLFFTLPNSVMGCSGRRHGVPRPLAIILSGVYRGEAMSLASEFKEFAMKGNVIDLAVGVVIGTAFGKIVSSLVADLIMPALGTAIGGINFSDLAVQIGADPAGKAVLFKYGMFIQTVFEFLLITFALFILVKGINRLKRPPPPSPTAPIPPTTEQLLTEIRDLLARRG